MKRLIRTFTILFLAQLTVTKLDAQQMAITIDDAPFGASGGYTEEQKVEAFEKLLSALRKHEVKATFFVTTSNLTKGTEKILERALEERHQLGNHTHGHLNLNEVTARTYAKDVAKCEEIAGKWINSRYFRYSYLRRGNTVEKRDSVYAALDAMNLVVAPVTIDNDEWIYNRDYFRAKSEAQKSELVIKYLDHMSEVAEMYKRKAIEKVGRQIPHILLIHVNPINWDHLDALLTQYKQSGWEFISLDEAMKDPFYYVKDEYVGTAGISQLDRMK